MAESPLDQVIRRHPADLHMIAADVRQSVDLGGGVRGHNHRFVQSPYFGHVWALAHDDAVNGLQLRQERLMRAFLPKGGFPEEYPRSVQKGIPGDAAQQRTLVGAC